MDLALTLRALWRRKLLVLLATVLSPLIAVLATYEVQLSPFSVSPKGVEFAIGEGTVLVDSGLSPIANIDASILPLSQRAQVINAALGGATVRRRIARIANVPVEDLAVSSLGAGGSSSPAADQRATQIVQQASRYQVQYRPTQGLPTIDLSTQAPDAYTAGRLVRAGTIAAQEYVRSRLAPRTEPRDRIELRQIATPAATVVNPGGDRQAAVAVALLTFGFLLFLILLLDRFRRRTVSDGDPAGDREPVAPTLNASPWEEVPPAEDTTAWSTDTEAEDRGDRSRPRRGRGS